MEEIKDRLSLLSESPHTDSLSILSALNPLVEDLFSTQDPLQTKKILGVLTSSLGHPHPVLSATIIEILSRVRSPGENPSLFIQELLYQLPRVCYPGTLVSAIGRLQPANASSTYMAILKHCPSSWPWLMDQIRKTDFEALAPLFAQVLLDPSPSIHLTSFRVTLRDHLLQKNIAESQFFISESIQWLHPSPENRVWIFEIIKKMSPDERLAMYASLIIHNVSNGMDPSELLSFIKEELKTYNGHNSVLCSVIIMLTKAFDKAFFGHYLDFLDVFTILFSRVENKYELGIFISSLLGVTLVPSKLLPQELWKTASCLINKYKSKATLNQSPTSPSVDILKWNKEVNLSFIKIRLLEKLSLSEDSTLEWLETLMDSKLTLDHLYIVKTIFLGSDSLPILKNSVSVLSKILSIYPQRSHGVLAVILHKLSRDTNPKTLHVILKSLSIVVKDKNCIKFVIKIANSLSHSTYLGSIRLKLLFDLYEVEDRTYPYLHKALETKYSTDDATIAKAYIIYKICSKKSSKHASDLLPLLSDILNSSAHEYASLLALRAIQAMCTDSVIDVETTLKAIQPKIMADGHVDVRVALMDICSLVPDFDVLSEKYEAFSFQTLKFLWSSTKKCQENPAALRGGAFRAIGKFGLYKQRFEFLPNAITDGFEPIKLTENELTTLYVPGGCWIKALVDSSNEDLPFYKQLLQDFLRDEIKEFPPSVYYLPHKKNEKTRTDYSEVLAETSVLRYLILTLQSENTSSILLSTIFEILSAEYPQQFPPLNWDFFLSFPKKYEIHIFNILIHQVRKSHIARNYLDRILDSKAEESPDMMVAIINKLELFLQYHNTPKLKAFLQRMSLSLIDKTPLTCILKTLKEKAQICMKYDEFTTFFKSLYEQASCDEALLDLYLDVIPHLPHEYWSHFSNPLLQTKITEPVLRNAIRTRRVLSMSDNWSLIWFNDCIEALETAEFDVTFIHHTLIQSFMEARRNSEANRRWIMDFMGLILSFVRRKKVGAFPLLFDIFVEALVVFSGLQSFLSSPSTSLAMNPHKPADYLPSAIQFCLLSEEKAWNSFCIPLGEWLLSLLRDDLIDADRKAWIRFSLSSFKYGSDFDQISTKLTQQFFQFP